MNATTPYAATAAITIRLGGSDGYDVGVIELTGREGLNELFEYTVQVCSYGTEIDLDAVLKASCTISIAAGGSTRYIHGIVHDFERLGEKEHYAYYVARIVPLHWILTKRFGSRIFQKYNCPDMTVGGIIRKVLLDGGVPEDMFRFVLPPELAEREYVVQYRETEYDFIARLMEEEGLTCYFEHSELRHVLVIGEAPTVFRPNPSYPTVTYCDPNGMENGAECVFGIRERRSVEYGAVGLTDFNFKRPDLDLRTRYPGGALPSTRYSARTAPPPSYPRRYGTPSYGPESPEYSPDGPGEHCGGGGESPDYGGGDGVSYGVRYEGPYGGRGSGGSTGGYDGEPSGGYNGGSSGGYNGRSSPPPGPSYANYAGKSGPPSGELYPTEPESVPGAPHGSEPYHESYARESWNAPKNPRYPNSPPAHVKHMPPPTLPGGPHPPGKTPPPVDYGCTEVKVDYPGYYLEQQTGRRLAQIRLEQHRSAACVFEMSANVRGLMAGYQFSLEYHPVEAFNREYLVTELALEARQSQSLQEDADYAGGFRFEARVRAIPAGVPYRPPCRTPQPYVHGVQTALVVGPANDEIHTDAYGRVKVQFHWDPDGCYNENSSCWIRVSQGMAGGQYGTMFLPRVGQEVIVDFLEGNPYRPIITGRVYNGDCMPPYNLPDYKTRSCIRTQSSPGGYGANEIRFEDKKYYEHLLVHAQRDFHLRSRANCFETVGGDRHTWIYGNHYEKIAKKSNLEVCLDRKEKVGGNQSLTVCGDVAEGIHGKHSESCAAFTLKTESGEVVIDAATGITLKVGGNFIKIDASGVYVMGTMINLNSGGSAGIADLRTPQPPYAPKAAYTTDYGYDMHYSCAPTPPPDGGYPKPPETPGDYETPDKPTAWVEIELVDEAGQPWPNETYELTAPDGTVYNGSLDANGQAHVNVETDGECQIRFPKLDMAAWERD